MNMKRWLAGCLGAAVILGCLPLAGAADDAAQRRQEDLDYLVETLTTKHPDFYANTTEQAVADKKAEIEAGLDTASELDFAIGLADLAALAHDSHTMLSVGSALSGQLRQLGMVPKWYDGRWTLTGGVADCRSYIGQEITSINGMPIDEVTERLSPMISYDNEVEQRIRVGQLLYVADVLEHYGVIDADSDMVTVGVRDAEGKETVLHIPCMTQAEATAALKAGEWITRDMLRKDVPVTEPDRSVYYKLLDLGGGTLYMQYNKCFEDPNLPMEQFAAEVEGKLASGEYTKFVIDLRSNGGGSDGVLYPITYLAQQFLAKGNAVYALAGENTFSSALINTVQLKDIGAAVVGTPTGGSVDHFGAVTAFELPNSKFRGQYSNKFIDLGSYYEAAKPYGVESFPPDITVGQSFSDYLNGIDTAVQYILTHDAVKPELRKPAVVSGAKIEVNGTPVAAAAYEIEGSNYFKLRDLAMAFAGTNTAFSVSWDGEANRVTIAAGAYTPVGGELEPLSGGGQTAARATAEVYLQDMGMPLVGKAYEIDGNHYFKLRDLCFMLGVRVEWDDAAQTIRIDTTKPYI